MAEECPLCLEELDSDDKLFFPCPCLYQVSWRCLINKMQKLFTFTIPST